MGKGLLQGKIPGLRVGGGGIEPVGPREYFAEEVVLTPPETGDDELAAKVRRAYGRLRDTIEKGLQRLYGGAESACQSRDADPLERAPPTLPVTPAYHATLSRSLAVVAAVDRDHVEARGGEVVYLGGDDALVIAPPAEPVYPLGGEAGREWKPRLPALEIARHLRLSWAGRVGHEARKPIRGFLYVAGPDGLILHLAPAPGAYGRSVSVLLADAMQPMWLAITAAHQLEEAKDHARVEAVSRPRRLEYWRKDVLVVASDTRGAVLLPQTLPEPRGEPVEWTTPVLRIYRAILHGGLHSRALHRLPEETGQAYARLLSMGRLEAALELVVASLSRSITPARLREPLSDVDECVKLFSSRDAASVRARRAAECLLSALFSAGSSRDAAGIIVSASRRDLIVNGVNYASNPYLSALPSGEEVLLPLVYAPFAAAYVYESGVWLPKGHGG